MRFCDPRGHRDLEQIEMESQGSNRLTQVHLEG